MSLRPLLAACFLLASLLKIPRSPDLDSYKLLHSLRNVLNSGRSSYTAELLANCRWTLSSHHLPDLAPLILSSDRLLREMRALRRTPPTTTMSAILQTKSWHSNEVSFRPLAPLMTSIENRNNCSSGSGPEARPPKVLSLAPLGRILSKFHRGICPLKSNDNSSLNPVAHPILESRT